MALMPQLSLQALVPQIEPPDFGRTMLLAQQIQANRAQEQMRMVQLSELLRQRQQELGAEAYVQQMQTGREMPRTMAERTAPALPGQSYLQHPGQSPTAAYDQLSPGTQAPPGTTYTAAPPALQPAAMTPPAPVARPPASGLMAFGRPGREMYAALQKAQAGDAAAQKDLMDVYLKRLDFTQQLLGVPNDQATYDQIKSQLQEVAPGMAQALPKTFDRQRLDAIMAQMEQAKTKAKGVQFGVQPHYFRDPQTGQTVPIQFGTGGEAVRTQGLQGLEPLLPVTQVPTGTGTQLRERAGGGLVTEVPKDIAGATQQKEEAEALTKYEAALPGRALASRQILGRMEQKHREAEAKIDRALEIGRGANFPTSGPAGSWLAAVGYGPGMDLRAALNTLRAEIGLEELVELKNRGGTLGQVSNEEGNRLERAVQNVDPDKQTWDELVRNLGLLKKALADSRDRLEQDYVGEFVERRGRPQPRTPRLQTPSGAPQGRMQDKTISREEIRALAERRGMTEAEVEETARNSGYRIGN